MVVYECIDDINVTDSTCITIGNFDGVHKGHQTLVKRAVNYSKKYNLKSVVFTFSNHPVNFFKPGYVKNIISSEDKKKILESLGVDILLNIPFNEEMTKISAEEYIRQILVEKLNAKMIIVGHDFSFARKKEGNADVLINFKEKYGYDVEVVTPVILNGKRVSSTDIRAMISSGDVVGAKKLLGRYYAIEGEVVRARQIGRTIGFPTANIKYNSGMVLPDKGIYATIAKIGDAIYCGATNVGTNPTVNGKKLSIETYILDFDEDIYGENLRIEFVEKIREEIKFNSKEELKQQLEQDVDYVRKNYVEHLRKHAFTE